MKRFSPPVLQRTLYSPSRAKKGLPSCIHIGEGRRIYDEKSKVIEKLWIRLKHF